MIYSGNQTAEYQQSQRKRRRERNSENSYIKAYPAKSFQIEFAVFLDQNFILFFFFFSASFFRQSAICL